MSLRAQPFMNRLTLFGSAATPRSESQQHDPDRTAPAPIAEAASARCGRTCSEAVQLVSVDGAQRHRLRHRQAALLPGHRRSSARALRRRRRRRRAAGERRRRRATSSPGTTRSWRRAAIQPRRRPWRGERPCEGAGHRWRRDFSAPPSSRGCAPTASRVRALGAPAGGRRDADERCEGDLRDADALRRAVEGVDWRDPRRRARQHHRRLGGVRGDQRRAPPTALIERGAGRRRAPHRARQLAERLRRADRRRDRHRGQPV